MNDDDVYAVNPGGFIENSDNEGPLHYVSRTDSGTADSVPTVGGTWRGSLPKPLHPMPSPRLRINTEVLSPPVYPKEVIEYNVHKVLNELVRKYGDDLTNEILVAELTELIMKIQGGNNVV
jgi:hypothetical protein